MVTSTVNMTHELVRALKYIKPLAGKTLQARMTTLYELQGFFNYGDKCMAYEGATHIITINPDPSILINPDTDARPALWVECVGNGSGLESWIIVGDDEPRYVVTTWIHRKQGVTDTWHNSGKKYSWVKSGEYMYFVAKPGFNPIPENAKLKPHRFFGCGQ
jgi:hypothetical protein